MRLALEQAAAALEAGEVPVGAAVARDGELISLARNEREAQRDVSAHAELLALRRAGEALGRWQLEGCTLYVTLEPCLMCAAAAQQARLRAIVFGAFDEKAGGCGSVYHIPADERLGPPVAVTGGLLAEESRALLRRFFCGRR